ncbi:hypothetical protein [Haloechinothrix sp. LS1_15]|uniref:hypothetical protein n=1 Tax=Haloechinothrix sp. LS1_15 TaxID=2652248 RepID=UPI002947D9BB|nr:hypothetical protein [Haloechinothrix sp. LS1_15]MDV6013362.1 hypothetical protein [Haloechinothrix sp. LS1_15]
MTDNTSGPHRRFSEDLVGLDPDDPEAQAFAEHLDRMETSRSAFTVEGALQGVSDFAESSTKLGGRKRQLVSLVVILTLLGFVAMNWETISGLAKWLTG